jgi:hypothetical protein
MVFKRGRVPWSPLSASISPQPRHIGQWLREWTQPLERKVEWTGRVAQVVACLPNKHKTLSSIPSTREGMKGGDKGRVGRQSPKGWKPSLRSCRQGNQSRPISMEECLIVNSAAALPVSLVWLSPALSLLLLHLAIEFGFTAPHEFRDTTFLIFLLSLGLLTLVSLLGACLPYLCHSLVLSLNHFCCAHTLALGDSNSP